MVGDEIAEPRAASLDGWCEGVGVASVAGRGHAIFFLVLIPVEAIMDEQWPVLTVGIDDI